MNTVASHDQFKAIRIRENLVVSYNCQSVDRPGSQSVSQSVSRSISQSVSQLVSQTIDQSVKQSVSLSVSHS